MIIVNVRKLFEFAIAEWQISSQASKKLDEGSTTRRSNLS